MGILFFGTPEFAVPSLRTLLSAGEVVSGVVTQPDRPGGRGRKPIPPPVKLFAEERGLPVYQPETIRDGEFFSLVREKDPEFIVVVAYGKIVPPKILRIPRLGPVNLHASLLPKYRGAAPIQWALLEGETVTGVTTMLMDEGLDTGDILEQVQIPIDREDTSLSLSRKLAEEGARLLLSTLKGLRQGRIKPKPQSGSPSHAPAIKKSDGLLDWQLPAVAIFNRVRAFYPWPSAYTYFRGKLLKILKAEVAEGQGEPGVIVHRNNERLLIGTGRGLIEPIKIQVEGKKPMETRSWLQGQGRDLKEGERFGL